MEFIKIKDKNVWFSVNESNDYTRLQNTEGVKWIKGTINGVSIVKPDVNEYSELESYFEEWQTTQEN